MHNDTSNMRSLFNFYNATHIVGVFFCYIFMMIHFADIDEDCKTSYQDIGNASMFDCNGDDMSRCKSDAICGMKDDTFGTHEGWGSECRCYASRPIYDSTIALGVIHGLFLLFFIVNFIVFRIDHRAKACDRYMINCGFPCVLGSTNRGQSIILLWDAVLIVLVCVANFWATLFGSVAFSVFFFGFMTKLFGFLCQRSVMIGERYPIQVPLETRDAAPNPVSTNGSKMESRVDVSPNAPPAWADNDNPPAYNEFTDGTAKTFSKNETKDLPTQITELENLRIQGIITDEEFRKAKAKLIGM